MESDVLCMERGFETEGILEGGLEVTRRAPNLLKKLEANQAVENDPMEVGLDQPFRFCSQ